jgi:DNA-binding transcriptional ArsR family regulator
MRKFSPVLSPWLSPTLQAVLAATILRPEREWYLSDLAAHLGVGPSSIQRVLAKLTTAGILARREDGNRVYYRPDPACPILGELAGIFTKTAGIAEPLRNALSPFASRIVVAFIHGSVAEERERPGSDIDLIIVCDVPGAELSFALQPLHQRLGRDVNFTRFTSDEFRSKIADRNHFLASVLRKRRIFLIGGEHELEEIAGGKARGPRAVEQKGAG